MIPFPLPAPLLLAPPPFPSCKIKYSARYISLMYIDSQGEDWYRQRQPMSKFVMVPRKVGEYHEGFNAISQDLLKNILQLRDSETKILSDVCSLSFKWSFECE